MARANWTLIDGQAAMRGVNLLDLPVGRFLRAVCAWVEARIGPEAYAKWEMKTFMPAVGETVAVGPWSQSEQAAVFMRAAGSDHG